MSQWEIKQTQNPQTTEVDELCHLTDHRNSVNNVANTNTCLSVTFAKHCSSAYYITLLLLLQLLAWLLLSFSFCT